MEDQFWPSSLTPDPKFVVSTIVNYKQASLSERNAQASLVRSHAAKVSSRPRTSSEQSSKFLPKGRAYRSPQSHKIALPNYRPQWRAALIRKPSCNGAQIINPFGQPDPSFDQTTYEHLRYFRNCIPQAEDVLQLALQRRICLPAVTACSAAMRQLLSHATLSPEDEYRMMSTAFATMRSHLSSDKIDMDSVLHSLALFSIAAIFRGRWTETKTHLKALSDILQSGEAVEVPHYLHDIIVFSDLTVAMPTLSSTVFDMEYFDVKYSNAPESLSIGGSPELSSVSDRMGDEVVAAGLLEIDRSHVRYLVQWAEALLYLCADPEAGSKVAFIQRRVLGAASRCLSIFNHEKDDHLHELRRRLSLAIILCFHAFYTPMNGFSNFTRFTDKTVSSFKRERTRANLDWWNANLHVMLEGLPAKTDVFCSKFCNFIEAELWEDFPVFGTFMRQYYSLLQERLGTLSTNTQDPVTVRFKLWKDIFRSLFSNWPVMVEVSALRLHSATEGRFGVRTTSH